MTVLIVETGPRAGARLVLEGDVPILVGSDSGCHLHVEGDGVEPRHLVVKSLKTGGYGAKGLPGEFELNGEAVAVSRISEGDRIRIGSVELRVASASTGAARADGAVSGGAADDRARPATPEPVPVGRPKRPPSGKTPGNPKTAHAALTEGDEIGGFKILGVLGVGGQGVVYRAEQVSLNREVALKVLDKDLTADPVFVARFQAEARAAARLQHPNVVQVYDVGHEGDTWFYSMELMGQGSVEDLVKQKGRLTPEEVVPLLQDAARAFEFAESLRIVHRDVKPDNLMIDAHGHAKLVDLGLALTDDDGTNDKVVGSPAFMSPEQALRRPVDHRSDLYSLGCTAYRMLTGKNPFKRASVKEILIAHVKEDAEPVHAVTPDVPAELGEIVARLMAKDAGERFQSASELQEALDDLLASKGPNKLALYGGGAALLIIAIAAIVYAATRTPEVIKDVEVRNTGIKQEDMARAEAEKREAQAEARFLQIKASGRARDAQLAAAFDEVAAEYAGTPGAQKASDEAEAIREEIEAARRAAEARRLQVERAKRTLQGAFDEALAARDFGRLAKILALDEIQEAVRDDEEVTSLRDQLLASMVSAVDDEIALRVYEVHQAIGERDPAAIRAAVAPLRALYEGDNALPLAALPSERSILLSKEATDALQVAEEIESERLDIAEKEAWERYAVALRTAGDDNALRLILALEPAKAAASLGALEDELGKRRRAAKRIDRLQPAFTAAERYWVGLVATLGKGERYPIELPESVEPLVNPVLVALETEGDTVRLRVQGDDANGRKTVITPSVATVGVAPSTCFPPIEGVAEIDRQAFLGLVGVAAHVLHGSAFARSLDPSNDASGTGERGFDWWADDLIRISNWLSGRLEGVENGEGIAAWRIVLAEELQAARRLTQGLGALSAQRDDAAAKLFGRLLREHPNSIAARAL
jgi:predicted Ser/Thr protein kinase